jgi:hypothetical protein
MISARQFGFMILFLLGAYPASAQVDFTGSNLPVVVIETGPNEIVDDPRITATMGIIRNEEGAFNALTDLFNDYLGYVSIEYRGATSQEFQKKSYGFETQDHQGENRNVSLMGLPVENDWVLYAPYSDKSLIRNILSYQLFGEMGHYSPRTRLCELVVNGDYRGVYVLIEKIKRDSNRLDIATLNPDETAGEDVTGGYILKIDKLSGDPGPVWNTSEGSIGFQYEYPEYDDIVDEQKAYIGGVLDEFESSLTAENFTDTALGYRHFLDAGSVVDMFIINEMSRNVDGYFLSTFLYKKADRNGGKLYMGPVWDFNLSFGNPDYREAYRTDGFQIRQNPAIWWWDKLLQDPQLIGEIRSRWTELRENKFSDTRILSIVDSLTTLLAEAQERNFTRWPILEYTVWPNYYTGTSYQDEIDYLKSWTLERLDWLDQQLADWTGQAPLKPVLPIAIYPNPFHTSLTCQFTLKQSSRVSLILYDLHGREIEKILDNRLHTPGEHRMEWSAPELPAAIYVLVLRLNGQIVSSDKVIKLK